MSTGGAPTERRPLVTTDRIGALIAFIVIRLVSRAVCPTRGWVDAANVELPLLLIVIGIVLAILVNYGLGIVCILIGLVLLIWPRIRGRRTRI
jgi:hypothetical protein